MPTEKAITIVGAGPAGLVCAIVLAKADRKVIVREWHKDVGHRFHDDFQGLENWSHDQDALQDLRDAGIDIGFAHVGVRRGVVFNSKDKPYDVGDAQPLFYLLRRGNRARTLDRSLLDQALAAGVEVRFNDRVQRASGDMVFAGGPRRADIIAVGKVFDTQMANGAWLALKPDLAPKGYAYLLVHQGRGTVASCMFTGFRNQAAHLSATLDFFERHAGLQMTNAKPFGGFGNTRLPRTAVQGGTPLIGEHAGFQDGLAGFGLRYAIYSGRLAAQSLIHGTDYTKAWKRSLQPALRTGVVNRFLFNLAGRHGIDFAVGHLAGQQTRSVLRQAYRPSALKTALFPLARYWFRAPLSDPSCTHDKCDCVWCEHGAYPQPSASR